MKSFVFIFLFGLQLQLLAFNKPVDSLIAHIKTAKADTAKVLSLLELSKKYYQTGSLEETQQYAGQALVLSQQLRFKKGMAKSHTLLGIVARYQGHYVEALEHHYTSLKIKQEVKDKEGVSASYNNIGAIYWSQGNYPEALTCFFASLKINRELNDKPGIATSCNNIGLIYSNQGNYAEALKNHFASLKIRQELNDKRGISASYNNIGLIYINQKKYEEALKNHFESLKIKIEIGDSAEMTQSYNNIGLTYDYMRKFKEAEQNYLAALKLSEIIGDQQAFAYSCSNLGMLCSRMNKPAQARDYLNKALSIAWQIGSMEDIKFSYKGLAELDSACGNYKQSLDYYKKFIVYRDSLINEENTKSIVRTEMNFEFEKKITADSIKNEEAQKIKDAEIEVQQAQLKQEKTLRYSLFTGLSLIVVFTLFLFNRFKITQKQKRIIELQNRTVDHQRHMAEEQRVLVEEKNKEITDSILYAEKIQRAIMPSASGFSKIIPNSFILFKPKDIVSGDFYWIQETSEYIFYATVDCTGHGVPGGFMSMLGTALLNEIINEKKIYEPADILDLLRIKIILALKQKGESNENKDGMDMVLCRLTKDFKELTYAAANNPLWIIKQDGTTLKLQELKADKQPVGINAGNMLQFNQHSFALEKGDTIYTFTDGYADQFGGDKGKKFKQKQLQGTVLSIAHLPIEGQYSLLDKKFENWKKNLEQVDDVLVIGIKV